MNILQMSIFEMQCSCDFLGGFVHVTSIFLYQDPFFFLQSDCFFFKSCIAAELVVAAGEEVVVKDKGDGKKKNKAKRLSKKMKINEKAGGSVRRAVTKFRRRNLHS